MALDPPLTQDEEDMVLLVRSLQTKETEVAGAEQTASDSSVRASAERAGLRNLRREFTNQMRKRGIDNPEALLRRRNR